ncbi:hypothetical protein SAMN05421678_11218 [Actinopolymorpha cephalotaxi]|uniref:Uncharacterized protein n=1 Tax=Actinopolymorpha cephalotaxi TaxID=504797 RepID=A0A1I2X639_9ACTN|nr:hypothetical protein [Actinopolymorpha cephalotaxi]NYH86081.1 hypothetical protein [Actinopolymorpha cephalotaxi]SFH09004.1 hypothetical protein SAMN05421678_11218 [Actinopolymorpha cephalotaxi]
MQAPRSGASEATWIIRAVVVAVIGWVVVFALIGKWTLRGGDFREDRESFRDNLMVEDGMPVALPVDLPPGYQVPDGYGSGGPADGPPDSTSVSFPPTDRAKAKDHLRDVELCAEHAANTSGGCPTDIGGTTIVRTVDGVRVHITLRDHNETNRLAWQNVPLTTDFDMVSWLH